MAWVGEEVEVGWGHAAYMDAGAHQFEEHWFERLRRGGRHGPLISKFGLELSDEWLPVLVLHRATRELVRDHNLRWIEYRKSNKRRTQTEKIDASFFAS